MNKIKKELINLINDNDNLDSIIDEITNKLDILKKERLKFAKNQNYIKQYIISDKNYNIDDEISNNPHLYDKTDLKKTITSNVNNNIRYINSNTINNLFNRKVYKIKILVDEVYDYLTLEKIDNSNSNTNNITIEDISKML